MADRMEEEIAGNTETVVRRNGTRCRGPTVAWKSILPEKQDVLARPVSAARWAEQACRGLRAAATKGQADSRTEREEKFSCVGVVPPDGLASRASTSLVAALPGVSESSASHYDSRLSCCSGGPNFSALVKLMVQGLRATHSRRAGRIVGVLWMTGSAALTMRAVWIMMSS